MKAGYYATEDGRKKRQPERRPYYNWVATHKRGAPPGQHLTLTGSLLRSIKATFQKKGSQLLLVFSFYGTRGRAKWVREKTQRLKELQGLYTTTQGFKLKHVKGYTRDGVTVVGHTKRRGEQEQKDLLQEWTALMKLLSGPKPPSNAQLGRVLSGWIGGGKFTRRRAMPLLSLTTSEVSKYQDSLYRAVKPAGQKQLNH